MVGLPKPPWYRRFGVVFLAANLVVAAVLVAALVALWPRAAAQRPDAPATTAGLEPRAEQLLPEAREVLADALVAGEVQHPDAARVRRSRGGLDFSGR